MSEEGGRLRLEETTQVGPPPIPAGAAPAYHLLGRPLGEILVSRGVVKPEQIDAALATQAEKGGRIGEILVSMKAAREDEVLRALADQIGLPFAADVRPEEIDTSLIEGLSINFVKQWKLMPMRRTPDGVEVAVADPLETFPFDDLRVILRCSLIPIVAPPQKIIDAINQVYDRRSGEAGAVMDDLEGADLDTLAHELEEPQDLLDVSDEAPIIRLVNSLLFQAVKERASDIHIEPMERDISVRFRVDGVLYDIIRPPKRFQSSITSRVKIMAGLNIAEKRLPQDGRIRIKIAGKDIDIRVATAPTSHGERITMRLLDRSSVLHDLGDLGFAPDQLKIMDQLIHKAHGIILVTGPTGSGKTTTLYACLAKINKPELNIITVEDPVEYQLKGISQIQVNPKINLTFASGLRSILRHDPDVIMVGEIRDLETAEIAIQASLTGHLVFSTLHTNDAPSAVTRLVDMGVEPFLVSSSVLAIQAQRLVRRVCVDCREEYEPTDEELERMGIPRSAVGGRPFSRGRGCPACVNTGYQGREGIYEILLLDDELRGLILKNMDSNTIKRTATGKGMRTLRDDGARKVMAGITSSAEVMRVTQADIV
jgi:general secretion pathway protein E